MFLDGRWIIHSMMIDIYALSDIGDTQPGQTLNMSGLIRIRIKRIRA